MYFDANKFEVNAIGKAKIKYGPGTAEVEKTIT